MGKGNQKQRQRVAKAPIMGQQKNTFKQEPIDVFLSLQFTDPEDAKRFFPKDFEVEVHYGESQKTEVKKVGDNKGTVQFKITREDAKKFKYFRLYFKSKDKNHVICEKRTATQKSEALGNTPTAEDKVKEGQRVFRLPQQWSILNSDWAVTADEKIYLKAEKEKKFLLTDADVPRDIGTATKPVELVLDPHWQYLKFEFFDRYYGHSDHSNLPISIPPIAVEGYPDDKEGKTAIWSNWTIAAGGDEKKSVQCLPWIIQAKDDGAALPKPDKTSRLEFKQPKTTYIVSTSATERKLKKLAQPYEREDGEAMKPCAKRLKYYDLPDLWKSKNYWCRLSDDNKEQGFFEKLADKKTTKDKPLVFSLDDIVLINDKEEPLRLHHTDKVVLFYHEFLDPVSDTNKRGTGGRTGAKYLKNGLYKPGLNQSEIKKQAKAEKDAREKAVKERKLREERIARQDAEDKAEKANARRSEIEKAGDQAVADLPKNKEAQARIKEASDKAGAHATKEALKAGTLQQSSDNIEVIKLTPDQAGTKAEEKQKAKEEQILREEAEKKQRKIEETKARKSAMETAKKGKTPPKEVIAAGDRAVARLGNDKDAQERIKKAGDEAAKKVDTDSEAQARIAKAKTDAKAAAEAYPFSDIKLYEEVPNYINDYPHWTRLVVYDGNLFDNFDKRTTKGDVIGARAAVRWVDTTPAGVGFAVNAAPTPRPEVVPVKDDQPSAYFVLHPVYEQQFFVRSNVGSASTRPKQFYDEWSSPIAKDDAKVFKNSRTDMAILRTSYYKDENEENVVFRFHRLSFDFAAQPSELNPGTGTPEEVEDKRTDWKENFVKICADRWNGNDTVNTTRAWIVEDKDADPKTRAQVVSFLQEVPKEKAHFHIETIVETGTSSMAADKGTGVLRVRAGRDTTGETSDRGFAGAHEIGHAGGQPDDYANATLGQTGFGSNHITGTPFILDATSMMKANKQVRGRSFWHITEWLRQLKPFEDVKFQIEHANYTYKIPHYNHKDRPGRNYTHWNVKSQVMYSPGDPVYHDSFLYFLGKDEYSQVILPSQPDGIMIVMIRLNFVFNGYLDTDNYKKSVFSKINQKINTALNATRIHAKFSINSIDRGGTNTFEKCLLHFSPRFSAATNESSVAHLKINLKTPPSGGATKSWIYQVGSTWTTSGITETAMHGKFNDGTVTDNTKVRYMTGTAQGPIADAKDVPEFEAKFTNNATPRTLDFRVPAAAGGTSTALPPAVMTRLENVVFKHVCELLGLSVKSTDANHYQTADAFKSIVKGCVNDSSLDPAMTRG